MYPCPLPSYWLPWRHRERTEKLLSMHLVVPWDRVALGLDVPKAGPLL